MSLSTDPIDNPGMETIDSEVGQFQFLEEGEKGAQMGATEPNKKDGPARSERLALSGFRAYIQGVVNIVSVVSTEPAGKIAEGDKILIESVIAGMQTIAPTYLAGLGLDAEAIAKLVERIEGEQ